MLLSKGPDSVPPSDPFMSELATRLNWNVVEAHNNDTEGYMKEFGAYFPVANDSERVGLPPETIRFLEAENHKSL